MIIEQMLMAALMEAFRDPRQDATDAQEAHIKRAATTDWSAAKVVEIQLGDGSTLVLTNTGTGTIYDKKELVDFDLRTVGRVHELTFNGFVSVPVIGRVDLDAAVVKYTADVDFDMSAVEGLSDVDHSLEADFSYKVNGETRTIQIRTSGYAWPTSRVETTEGHWCEFCKEWHEGQERKVYTCDTSTYAFVESVTGRVDLTDDMVTLRS